MRLAVEQSEGTAPALPAPAVPYVGVRSYEVHEARQFVGRTRDVDAVTRLIADSARWRLILLHGMTGAGKSSFLKAGLIPVVTEEVGARVYARRTDLLHPLFITAGADPLARLAEAVADLCSAAPWWRGGDNTGLQPTPAEVAGWATDPQRLSQALAERAPQLSRPLLLIVDQAEEVFTRRTDREGEAARARFFDFLSHFCRRPHWIQILVSMRTEFYGRFDDALRQRLGPDLPVAPYLMAGPDEAMLESVIRKPDGKTFETPDGRRYTVRGDPQRARQLAERLWRSYPGPGALTALQVVGVRMVTQALGQASWPADGSPASVVLSDDIWRHVQDIDDVIEDRVDDAIAAFCEPLALSTQDALRLWEACKRTLVDLVSPQAEGAPVTRFLPRSEFIDSLYERALPFQRSTSWVDAIGEALTQLFESRQSTQARVLGAFASRQRVKDLVGWLERPDVRVLRNVPSHERGAEGSGDFVALGHDLLAVGLLRARARSDWRQNRMQSAAKTMLRRVVVFPLVGGALLAAVLLGLRLYGVVPMSWSSVLSPAFAVALVTLYIVGGIELGREIGRPWSHFRSMRDHLHALGERRDLVSLVLALQRPLRQPAALFHRFTQAARRAYAEGGAQAFPGSALY